MTSSADPARRRSSVVCGVDHSDHAVVVAETATLLATRLGLRLVFVHAVPASVPPLAPVWPHHARSVSRALACRGHVPVVICPPGT